MLTRRHSLLLSGLVAALLIATASCAQSPPSTLGTDVTSAVELSQQQVAAVGAYVTYWSGVLNAESSKPSDVERARDELVRPMSQPGVSRQVSPNFRGTYAKAVLAQLQGTLAGTNVYRAINAVRVVSALGTDAASNLLLMHADSQSQTSWEVRLRSADGERLLLLGNTLDVRKIKEAATRLRDASMREENWMVLRNQLEALHASDSMSLPPTDRTAIRGLIGEAIASAAQRAAASQEVSDPMLMAMGSAVSALRVRITAYSKQEQQAIGATLGPALGKLLDWVRPNWEALKGNERSDKIATAFVSSAEGLLQFFDPVLIEAKRPTPTTDMRTAWIRNDKPKYETDVSAWQAVLGKAPYRP